MNCENQEILDCKEAKEGYLYCSSCVDKLKKDGYSDQDLQPDMVAPEDVCAENEFWPLLRNKKIVGYYKSKAYAQSIVDALCEDKDEEAHFEVGKEKVKNSKAGLLIKLKNIYK